MANTAPLPIVAAPPYRRETALRHRRTVTAWAIERAVRSAKAWLGREVSTTRGRHAAIAAGYSGIAILVGAIAAAVIR